MKKIVIGGIIVVLAIAVLYFGGAFKGASPFPPAPVANTPVGQTTQVSATAGESTPDAIVSYLLAPDAQSEVTPMEADPTLTAANDQALNDFDQSFDASQF